MGRSTGRTLWRDDVLVGMVDSPEIAQDIVAAMRVVGRLLDEQPEAARERSRDSCDCPAPEPRTDWSRVDPYDTTKGLTP